MISHDYKFIFVHIGRTGGSSLERLFGVDVTKDSRTAVTGNTDFREKHKDLSFYYRRYPKEFDRYFKFTIIRNPYDRLVSAWLWRCNVVKDHDCSLKEFISKIPDGWGSIPRLTLDHLSFDASVKRLDFIARFETLQDDVRTICNRVGFDASEFPHTNKTMCQPYWEYYDDEALALATQRFGDEIEYFGYKFGADCNERKRPGPITG